MTYDPIAVAQLDENLTGTESLSLATPLLVEASQTQYHVPFPRIDSKTGHAESDQKLVHNRSIFNVSQISEEPHRPFLYTPIAQNSVQSA